MGMGLGLRLGLGSAASGGAAAVSYSLYDPYAGAYPYTGYTPILIVAGDSNSVGGPNAARSSYTPTANVKIYDPATENFAATYTPGTFAGIQDPLTKLGNWSAEGQFVENFVTDFPGKKLRIVKIGYGGTTLDDNWLPGDGLYGNVTYGINKAIAAVTAEGGDPPLIIGLIFHCGTNDAGTLAKANAFQANMVSFLDTVRTNWQIPSTAPIMWVRQKAFDTKPYWATVKAAQNAVAPSYPYLKLINTDDVPGDDDGDIHFGRWGQNLIGARCYKVLIGSRYSLQELSGPSILNPNFDTSIDYWPAYNGTVSHTWGSGKLNFPATLNGEVTGWTANTVPGNYYLIDYVATGHGADFSNAGTRAFGVGLSVNRQINQSGRTGTIGFKADNSSQGIDLFRSATAAGASTFDTFTIRQGTVGTTNEITNGDMSSSTGWTLTNASISGGVMAVTNGGGGTFASRSIGPLVSGAVYELEIVISAYTSGTFSMFISGDSADNIGALGGAAGTVKQVFHANGAYSAISLSGAYVASIDSIALRRIN